MLTLFRSILFFVFWFQHFHVHPLTIEDISTEEQREKYEVFRHYYFVCFRTFDQDYNSGSYLQPASMYSVVFRDGIITVSYPPFILMHISYQMLASLDGSIFWCMHTSIDYILSSLVFWPGIGLKFQVTQSNLTLNRFLLSTHIVPFPPGKSPLERPPENGTTAFTHHPHP